MVTIRESGESDKDSIREVHLIAFGEPEGESVSRLAIELLEDETALPVLSLVAEQDGEIVGSAIFTRVRIEGARGVSARILCPLAVTPENHGKGIGTKLIERGLVELQRQGADVVLVLGDPNYYARTGFRAGHHLTPPYTLAYPEAWMARELVPGVVAETRGQVHCASCLHSPEHW